ncbi:MAG: glycerophosphodiester phosphodiesterase family protein [Oscillospiraceae bacterium]
MDLLLGLMAAFALALLAILSFWIFSMAPRLKNRPSFTEFQKYDYAHRGLHSIKYGGKIPENSMAAFKLAVENGFGMEFDLQLSLDGYVVIHHDNNLKRICGVDRLISQLTLEELSKLHLSGTEQGIPLLTDVLEAVAGSTPLIIELKGYGNTKELCEKSWEILKNYTGLYCVESFDPFIVEWFRENHPEVVRGQLMAHFRAGENGLNLFTAFFARNLFTNSFTRPDFEAYDYTSRMNISLRVARSLFHMQEVSWTIRDPQAYDQCKREQCLCIFEGFDPTTEPDAQSARAACVSGSAVSCCKKLP